MIFYDGKALWATSGFMKDLKDIKTSWKGLKNESIGVKEQCVHLCLAQAAGCRSELSNLTLKMLIRHKKGQHSYSY